MSSRLRIKFGLMELEYEGDAQFDSVSIKDIFSHLESLTVATPAFSPESAEPGGTGTAAAKDPDGGAKIGTLHMNTVASRLGAASGSDLAVAAAAYLQIVLKKERFSRKDLLDAMKSATTYYNANMSSNLTKMLDTLITNKRINQLGQSDYSMTAGEMTAAETKLAE